MRNRVIFTGKSIYRRETVSNKNTGLVDSSTIVLASVIRSGCSPSRFFVIYKALCFDVAHGRMNGAPNETRTHLCRFASPACFASMRHEGEWVGRPMRLELTCVGLLVQFANRYTTRLLVIYKALCFDVAQGRMNGVPNETRTYLCRFASPACKLLHHQRCPPSRLLDRCN